MDYEKAYKEALEDMRVIYPNLKGDAKLAVEHAFPQLRESEDERIRRELIEYLRGDLDDITTDDTDRWIAYLEKQKEPKHAPDDLQKSFEAGQTSIVDNPEQYGLCKKAEWSEEDESMLWNIISIVGQCKSVQADSMLDWLKSLRPQPQGVFERAVRAIYEMCHSYRNKGVFTDERACDFMGNVRLKCKDAIECSPILDEPHWKPSEEQMDNLLRVASALDAMHYKNESKVLVEFYNNLKS